MVGALLIPALAGFVLLMLTHVSRYWLNRQSGYKLFFATACAGAMLLVVSRAVIVFCVGPENIPTGWYDYAPFSMSETLGLSIVLAFVFPVPINLVLPRDRAARLIAKTSGDHIKSLLEDSLDRNGAVELTMKNGKVYIGFPRESGVGTTGEPDISLVPIVSGYRDETDKTLVVTTRYEDALLHLVGGEGHLTLDDFQVILPMREVCSARFFDPHAYELLQDQGED